ncbi:DUF4153 domain-containing protein [uncultured Psychrosphaera sp.]|uniref:DUF4153 domain-containing protein n=1 Tax=uncultured Psychrosphaera sp. TaxID=1403522 RepID=UPI002616271E|nr:DUF4153 domain-containing protein [uncultured Psychrosphaera sp.]
MDNQLPKPLIIIISLIQGILLTLLYQSSESQSWPSSNPIWFISLMTFIISFPFLTLLCITKQKVIGCFKYLLPFSLVLSLLGAYIGLQQLPLKLINNDTAVIVFIFTILIASFKALMYIQLRLIGEKANFQSLFKLSWQNFIIFAECCLFVLVFWGILNLGAELFSILGIHFFTQLLDKNWFVIPVLNLAFGFAIIIFRNITATADSIATILKTLIKFLLPALSIISLGFLTTLIFTGLDTLWETGKGSSLALWLQALTLFFVNAVYQGNIKERIYHPALNKIIIISVALLPLYSIISFYGIWSRIDQYGLTVSRCWAVLVCFLLACFSVSYLFGIIKKRGAWLEIVSKVNVVMGLVVMFFMLLVNSPLLSFQSLTANNQITRLQDGTTAYQDFSYHYFANSLGRQGYLALQEIRPELQLNAPEKVELLDGLYVNYKYDDTETEIVSIDVFKQSLTYWPEQSHFPEDLIQAIYDKEIGLYRAGRKINHYVLAKDLNNDGELNFVFISEEDNYYSAYLFQLNNEQWEYKYMDNTRGFDIPSKMETDLLKNKVEAVTPQWNDLKIGNVLFRKPIH